MARKRRSSRKYGSSTRKGMRRKTARRAYMKKNPAHKKIMGYFKKHPVAGMALGAALGYVFYNAIGGIPVIGDTLDMVSAKVSGLTDKGAVALGAVFDPYGAVHVNPGHYGAIGMGAAHNLAAEHAARNTLHSYMYPPPGLA
jgi:hypothetical protein